MKSFKLYGAAEANPEIIRLRRIFGSIYGAVAGLAFAFAAWGWNGYMLSQSHVYYAWLAFLVGGAACLLFGGFVGWLTARFNNSLAGVVLWILSALFFAWLIAALPLQLVPALIAKLDAGYAALTTYSAESAQLPYRFGVAATWIFFFTLILGAAQLPIVESAAFSASSFGKIAPFFFCVLVMGIGGAVTDSLINVYFREALLSLDQTIQFVVDNKGKEEIDLALARRLHAKAFGPVEALVREERFIVVGGYDNTLEALQVLVKFGDEDWVGCRMQNAQLILCENLSGK